MATLDSFAAGAEEEEEDSGEFDSQDEMSRLDKDGDGKVTQKEVLDGIFGQVQSESDDGVEDENMVQFKEKFSTRIANLWPKADADGDGSLDVKELGVLMNKFQLEQDEL